MDSNWNEATALEEVCHKGWKFLPVLFKPMPSGLDLAKSICLPQREEGRFLGHTGVNEAITVSFPPSNSLDNFKWCHQQRRQNGGSLGKIWLLFQDLEKNSKWNLKVESQATQPKYDSCLFLFRHHAFHFTTFWSLYNASAAVPAHVLQTIPFQKPFTPSSSYFGECMKFDPPSKRTRICGHGHSSDFVQRLSLAGGSKVTKRSVDNRSTTWFASSRRPLIFFPNTVISVTANSCERWEAGGISPQTTKVSHWMEETCSFHNGAAVERPDSICTSDLDWTREPSWRSFKVGVGRRSYGLPRYLNSTVLTSTGCINFSFKGFVLQGIQGRGNGKSFTNFEKVSSSSLRALRLTSCRPPRASVRIPWGSRPNMR